MSFSSTVELNCGWAEHAHLKQLLDLLVTGLHPKVLVRSALDIIVPARNRPHSCKLLSLQWLCHGYVLWCQNHLCYVHTCIHWCPGHLFSALGGYSTQLKFNFKFVHFPFSFLLGWRKPNLITGLEVGGVALFCCPKVRKIRNEACSCPGIFSRTLLSFRIQVLHFHREMMSLKGFIFTRRSHPPPIQVTLGSFLRGGPKICLPQSCSAMDLNKAVLPWRRKSWRKRWGDKVRL